MSSSWESEPVNSGRHSRGAATEPQCSPTRSPPPCAVPRARAPRARSVHRLGNLALKKSPRRAPTTRAPRGVKRRQTTMEGLGSPRRKRPQPQHESKPSNAAPVTPDLRRDPAGAPLPMSRHALSYLRLTGAITPERASRIVVVSTPEGRHTPLPHGPQGQGRPTDEGDRNIPPGIARMLQQISTPHARPQQLPRREARPSSLTSRAAPPPTGPCMKFTVASTPSPRVLSRPGQYSPSPAWSPAVTSSWHSVRHMSLDHWSPACTSGGGGLTKTRIPPTCPPPCWRHFLRTQCLMLPRERTTLTVSLMRTWTNTKSSTLPHPPWR